MQSTSIKPTNKKNSIICCIDMASKQLFWSGANNPYGSSETTTIEYKADKQPIGSIENLKPFTTHTINLLENDTVFIFTDGFADQFGGTKGKKFKYAQFKELLLKIMIRNRIYNAQLLIPRWKNGKEILNRLMIFWLLELKFKTVLNCLFV